METIEVLKNVQRIALECMIGRKPVHINVGIMPDTGGLCVTVQDRSHEVVYMEIFNDWMPDHKEWNKKTYDRFMSVISDMTCVRLAG
ncbi:hypothetical protein [Parabacteroides distasonis]|uniref:Uncharacterized protein n=1 Tax=Parabacteroides distasonis TaxID=823 RepID=A0A4S2EJK4_PARDI|nr:hypothetical protein [Parabacteroides distasonis]TGY54141.1 hypothetical protein E5342_17785 [Parabacteroides distasonis]